MIILKSFINSANYNKTHIITVCSTEQTLSYWTAPLSISECSHSYYRGLHQLGKIINVAGDRCECCRMKLCLSLYYPHSKLSFLKK